MIQVTLKYKAFTLVELIITIIIIAILASITFLSLRSYPISVRDTVRLTDLQNIKKTLDLYALRNQNFPQPYPVLDTTEDGWAQGLFNETQTSLLEALDDTPKDPKSNTPYTYEVSPDSKSYRLIATAEETGEKIVVSSDIKLLAHNTNCNINEHLEGGLCISNLKNCHITNGSGQKIWNGTTWSECTPLNCDNGYTKSGNHCISELGSCENNNLTDEQYFTIYNGQITGFNEAGGSDILIPCSIENTNVTGIGVGAFDSKQLTSVVIPNSITHIGVAAFRGNKLTSVILGKNVVEIGTSAFSGNLLTDLIIPDKVTKIGVSAFKDNHLTRLTLGKNVEYISTSAFRLNNLTKVSIPNSIKRISVAAFSENGSMNNSNNISGWSEGTGGIWNLIGNKWEKE